MREKRALRLSIAIAFLVLACAPCGLLSGQPSTPSRPIATSTAAAQRLETQLGEALAEDKGEFTLRLTNEEATSYLALKLEEAGGEAPISDLRVWFTPGKIHITGDFSGLVPIQAYVAIVASAEILDGELQITIEKASAGSIPLPAAVLTSLSQTINETFQESQIGFQIIDVEIGEGEMIITGRR